MSVSLHPSSIIEKGAKLGENVSIGPFCMVGAHVELGDGCTLKSHVVVAGLTTIGANARIFPFASVGHEPQDLKYHNEPSTLSIGDNCTIREGVTINPGTQGGGLATTVGDNCLFLANAHVAHDCRVGNNVILSNAAMIAGHCTVGDFAILGGACAVHQFCRIGAYAFVGGLSGVENDIIPFGMAVGNRAFLGGLNVVGLRRHGISREETHGLRQAYKHIFSDDGVFQSRLQTLPGELLGYKSVSAVLAFIREGGERALCTPRTNGEGSS